MKQVLAFDFGASSGRAMLAGQRGGKLTVTEIHRFDNTPVPQDGHLRWDFGRLFAEVKTGIKKAVAAGGFDAVGFDSWGVDFGLIDASGALMENPVHYRDARCEQGAAETHLILPQSALYARTGIQYMPFNTVYQLYWMTRHAPETLARAKKILLIADLFAYLLTGEMRLERTNASTTGLLNAATQEPDAELLRQLGIDGTLLAEEIDAGEVYGTVKKELCDELGCAPVPVVAVATHDTASAVVSVPTSAPTVYISCGTWSLMGTELPRADTADPTFTNEIGYGKSVRYLKNIMGLWMIQQTRLSYGLSGFGEMVRLAEQEKPFAYLIDVDDPVFMPPGDMPARVTAKCAQTGQGVPKTKGEVIRAVYESLALKYRLTYEKLCAHCDRLPAQINMVGGGINAELLCRMTASACGVPVEAGPGEATALGNAAVQLIALGEIADLRQARALIRQSVPLTRYEPQDTALWDAQYARLKRLFRLS